MIIITSKIHVLSCPRIHFAFTKTTKMTNRDDLLAMISRVMILIKNSDCRNQRFTLLDNAQILTGILQGVTVYEKKLLMDLDVD